MSRWKPDGSVVLSLEDVQAFADILSEWDQCAGWMHREDCQNWKTDIDARENRRESVVYGNCCEAMKAWIGRRNINKLLSPPT